jgi:hypothetical protein
MPQEAIDRNIERDLTSLRPMPTREDFRNAAIALTWFRYHEMSMLADFFVDSILARKFNQFYVDDRVSARGLAHSRWLPSSHPRGVGRRDMDKAVLSLKRSLARHR